ncbi:MAG: hypothetical protein HQM12_13440 [SAR324 cluster bacterium]|nr:hypothetical protein [SAR324 cluster bacterium]
MRVPGKIMNKLLLIFFLVGMTTLTIFALMKEVDRNENDLQSGISGVISVDPYIASELVKTDNAHLFLLDPETHDIVASTVIDTFVPPTTFYIGEQNAIQPLIPEKNYQLLVIVDKDGQVEIPSHGEVAGPITAPLPLGTERYAYLLDHVYSAWPLKH